MSNNKQDHIGEANKMVSSVELLVNIVKRYIENLSEDDLENLSNLFEQAKEMEKVIIIDAFDNGQANHCLPIDYENGKQYYKETFGV